MAWPLPINFAREAMLQRWGLNFPPQFGVPPHRPGWPVALGGTNTVQARPRKNVKIRPGSKRPLNSFMAFRSCYSPIFRDVQQKLISGIINAMWQHDPFKAKWALIAKAYTIIRDRDADAPIALGDYLHVVCPKVGIINSDDYLGMLNWVWVQDAAGAKKLVQNSKKTFTGFDQRTISTNMNEQDIVDYCFAQGLISGAPIMDTTSVTSLHLMATTPQEAQQAFLQSITENPQAMAAQILGLDVDNRFLEISASEEPQYEWTGNLSELYNSDDQIIDIDAVASTDWNTTDLTNPMEFDNSLESVGYDLTLLNPDLPDHENLMYSFWNSF